MRVTDADDEPQWFVVHTKPKCEHIAAANLAEMGIESFCPRIRYQKTTRRGRIWFLEALFPCYLFARFSLREHLRAVNYAQTVLRVVRFGDDYQPVPAPAIAALREEMGEGPFKELRTEPDVGDEVVVAEGPLLGLKGVVTARLTGKDRVRILLEFLGKENVIEAKVKKFDPGKNPREFLAAKP